MDTFLYATCPAICVPPKVRRGAGVEVQRAAGTGGRVKSTGILGKDFGVIRAQLQREFLVMGLRLGYDSLCGLA